MKSDSRRNSIQEQERNRDLREFNQVFLDGKRGEPDDQLIHRAIRRQKASRKEGR